MLRIPIVVALAMLATNLALSASETNPALRANEITGKYVEVRTCQVYTGPCFANGEVGSAGKNAIMTWAIEQGQHEGVDLAGQTVAVVVKASHTLGFAGLSDPERTKALIVVNEAADVQQQAALKSFALAQAGLSSDDVVRVETADIEMQFDLGQLTADVRVGEIARLQTRKARKGDCICSNESAYYPPLITLANFVPGVAIEGDVTARSLGTRWSVPGSRSAYLGVFKTVGDSKLASRS